MSLRCLLSNRTSSSMRRGRRCRASGRRLWRRALLVLPHFLCSCQRPLDMPQCLAAFLGLLLLVLNLACGQQQPDSPLLSSRSYTTDGQPAAVLAPNTALQGLPLGELPASSPEACSQQCLQDDECSWFNYCSSEVDWVGVESSTAATATATAAATVAFLAC